MNSRYGKQIEVSSTVSANLSGSSWKPGANARISSGMAISAIAVSSSMNTSMLASTRSAKARASAAPPCSSRPANIGTKAALNAPSANSRRNRFGSRCATNHASATALVPNQCAISISRTNPSTREIKVMNPTLRTERMENIRGQRSEVR